MLSFFLQNRIAEAGNCIPYGTTVKLTRQTEVDSFPINYHGCDVVEGYLIIEGIGINNLLGLSQLKNADILEIKGTSIVNLSGLNSLKTINKLVIVSNSSLNSFNGLSIQFTQIDYLVINSNSSITDLSGLDKIEHVHVLLIISDNASLSSLRGLNSIKSVFEFNLEYNPLLTNLSGLESLDSVKLKFLINGNYNLENLIGLDSISSLNVFEVTNSPSFISFLGLNPVLDSITDLLISKNSLLVNMNGLESIKSIDNLLVSENPSLFNFQGLDNLQHIYFSLDIQSNPSLENLDGFSDLSYINDLSIGYNSSLINISQLGSNLIKLNGAYIRDNPSLISLDGLVNNMNMVDFLIIVNNQSLANLNSLITLTNLNIGLEISGNPLLINLSGLDSIKNISQLIIYNNIQLQELEGLNPKLENLDSLQIFENPLLKCCYIAKQILNNPLNFTIANIIRYIENNDFGCSSIPEVLALNSASNCCVNKILTDTITICQGSTYTVGSNNYTTSGIYRDTFQLISGCDSIIISNLTVRAKSYTIQNKNLCIGQSFILSNGRIITTNGTYNDTIPNVCDSIIEYRLNFLNNITTNQNASICKGKTYTLPDGNMVSVSGIYRDTLRASFSCDSIVITNLTVTNPIPFNNSKTICRGKTFTRPNGNIVSTSGIYYDTIKAPNTCDSIVITNLTVTNPIPFTNNVTICSGKTFTRPNGTIVSSSGIYYDTIKAPNTCDSIVITNLTVTSYLQASQTNTVCFGKSFVLPSGRSVSQNGIYKDTIRNNFGCDSIITTNLTITNPIPFTNTVAICDGQNYTLPNGNKVSSAGIYTDTLSQLNTCDSIIVTNLSVFPNNFTVSLHATDTIESGNGITLLPVISSGTAISWNWTPAASLSCTSCENPLANPTQNTLYTVTVKATDGCEDTAQTNIVVRQTNVYIPSAFTPNNDGVNDVAEVFAINPKSFSFKIYNRWGELVFESNDVSNKWNGTFKGENCPQDNYSYILDVTMQNDKTYHKQGGILLLR